MNSQNDQPFWNPSNNSSKNHPLNKLKIKISSIHSVEFKDTKELHKWSIENLEDFWEVVFEDLKIIYKKPPHRIVNDIKDIANSKWFEGAELNPVETLLRKSNEDIAIIYNSELGERRILTWKELNNQVNSLSQWMLNNSVKAGDRVVGLCPNVPEAIIGLLSTASVGGIWSICSPEYGLEGILDRFSDLNPCLLIASTDHTYKGKIFNNLKKIRGLKKSIKSIKNCILISNNEIAIENKETLYKTIIKDKNGLNNNLHIDKFQKPGCILFSSGSTGKPKCIVHSLNSIIIQLLKEHKYHYGLQPDERFYYHTSTSWNMWYWIVTALAAEAVVVLRDGSPFFPCSNELIKLISREKINVMGISPKYIDYLSKLNINKDRSLNLDSLRLILSTGSILPASYYKKINDLIKEDICISSISGGTEIMCCFASGDQTSPVWAGEIQTLSLGMDVKIVNEKGEYLAGEKGELICESAFPSHPLSFWNDNDGKKYLDAYFYKFPGKWFHGDFAEITDRNGMIIYGRSDATLKPGGIRIGTGELYPRINKFLEVEDSLVSGVEKEDGDIEIIAFIKTKNNIILDDILINKIKLKIRIETTPWHVPKYFFRVNDIPYTLNGKIAEIPIRNLINNRNISNLNSLINPESIKCFKIIKENYLINYEQ